MQVFTTVQWKTFFRKLYDKVDSTDLFNRAAQVAFYFSFAFFPLLLFLVTLIGIVLGSTENLKRELYSYLFQIMPPSAFDLVHKTLEEIVENSSSGKLTIGVFITLWSASAGVDSIRSALNAVYELKEARSWWNTKLQSLILTLLFILLIAIALIAVSSGWQLFQYLLGLMGLEVASPLILISIQWISLLIILLFSTEVIYSWVPCFDKFRWVWITPGALVAMVLWVVFTGGFRIYLQYFNTYNKAYGSLGAVIILMLWMFLSGTTILIGGAINSVLADMAKTDETQDAAASLETDAAIG
ncbi:MAG: YihY/virulence factor BrkB family protein [Pyrinomonadaceae bacterium]